MSVHVEGRGGGTIHVLFPDSFAGLGTSLFVTHLDVDDMRGNFSDCKLWLHSQALSSSVTAKKMGLERVWEGG